MVDRKVRLKNLDGDYLYPYTDNIPAATANVAGKVKVDTLPVSGSVNAISSGAVFSALANKLDKTATASKASADANGNDISTTYALKKVSIATLASSGTISLADNSVNRIVPSGTVTFSLPSVSDHAVFHQILVQMNLSTKQTVNLGTNNYFSKTAPEFETGRYNIIYEHNGAHWVVGAIATGAAE
jgi:hypothetical protein|nr:MAG TPA: hypothetical protein [Caudoviricetes sp.]DAK19495.1 MAG TPA: hypothetical protein [Caudoviricetes sp.]DAY91688.1 MAG TPA: hypothetical protein [Caudoviricetes sp.]DAZ18806.1 MAG TPA: hypothetical protein [Caudoviricetes sp.]